MNPHDQMPREEAEAKLTALLLGELPAEEAFTLGRLIAQDSELEKQYDRLRQTIGLVRELAKEQAAKNDATDALKLSDSRREKLLQQFKTVKPAQLNPPPKKKRLFLIEIAAILAILAILSAMLLPALSPAKSKARKIAGIYRRQMESRESLNARELSAETSNGSSAAPPPVRLTQNASAGLMRPETIEKGKALKGSGSEPNNFAYYTDLNRNKKSEANGSRGGGIVLPSGGQASDDLASTTLAIIDAPSTLNLSGGGGGAGSPSSSRPADPALVDRVPSAGNKADLYYRNSGHRGFSQLGPDPEQLQDVKALKFRTWSMDASAGTPMRVEGSSRTLTESAEPASAAAPVTPSESTKLYLGKETRATTRMDEDLRDLVDPATGLPTVAAGPSLGFQTGNIDQSGLRPALVGGNEEKPALLTDSDGSEVAGANGVISQVLSGNVSSFGMVTNAISLPSIGRAFGGTPVAGGGEQSVPSQDDLMKRSFPARTLRVPGAGPDQGISSSVSDIGGLVLQERHDMPKQSRAATETTSLGNDLFDSGRAAGSNPSSFYSLGVVGYSGTSNSTGQKSELALQRKSESDTRSRSLTLGEDKNIQSSADKKSELDEAKRFGQVLAMTKETERNNLTHPPVTVVETATIGDSSHSTFWGDLRSKLTREVEKSATVKVERDQTDIAGMSDQKNGRGYDPYFIQSEFELIQSETVLEKVVKELNLQEAWAKKKGVGKKLTTPEALALLRKKIELNPRKGTSLIDIRVKDEKPGEAANIANAIAKTYSDFRNEQRSKLTSGRIAALDNRAKQQEQEVAQVTQELKTLETSAQPEPLDAKLRTPSPAAPVPQPEIQTHDNAFSTFSLNVSDVSFKLTAASLDQGQMPDPASIRTEEFLNAFDYRDPEAPPGVPVAFAWDRAAYPFAQNRDLLRFSVKTAAHGRQAGQPMNIVLLLDNSGSMERADRVRIIHEALQVLATQLSAQDKLSVVTFSRTARLRVDGVPGNQAAQVAEQIGSLTPEGGTNLEEAMKLAYQTATRHYLPNGINRVVLLTDGAANLGEVDPETLKQKVEAQRKQGIALDCFGIGWDGYNDDLLEVLSRNGDGRYGFLNTPEEAAADFVGQLAGALHVAASDVKVQVEFNPKRTTAYRQIGYAKHQLTKEQFRDNTVDAAEIGAAESGNALYVIETNPAGEGPVATVRVRFKTPGTSDYHEHEWTVPYTGKASPLEEAAPALRLAAAASAFSEWLAVSPYAGEVTTDRMLQLLSGVPEIWGADARPKKLEALIRQARSLAK